VECSHGEVSGDANSVDVHTTGDLLLLLSFLADGKAQIGHLSHVFMNKMSQLGSHFLGCLRGVIWHCFVVSQSQ
jgi:hypothetical protein